MDSRVSEGGISSYSSSVNERLEDNSGLISKKSKSFDSVLSVLLLNCSMAGIQFTFAIMSTVLTPYNDFLNMSESEKTAIAVIGPICGFIIQPIFGSWSDNCHFKFGRRRIFMLSGVLFIVASLAFIGYGYIDHNQPVAEALAITGMILMNVSINVVLCPARAIVSDLVSGDAQNKGQIYAALMMGLSFCLCNFIVYGLSFMTSDLKYGPYDDCYYNEETGSYADDAPWSRATLTMVICSIGIVFVILVQIPTMIYGKEERILKDPNAPKEEFIFVKMFKQIRYMPNIILRVCIVFFGSWAGYYPFQMFCSDIYGIQLGSLANAIGAIVTFIVSIFLDKIVRKIGERNTYKISQGIGALAMTAMVIPFLYVNNWKDETDENTDPVELSKLNRTSIIGDADPASCEMTSESTEVWVQVVVCILVGLVGINNAVMNSVPFGIVGKCGDQAKGLYMGILNCCCVLAQALSILIDVIWTAIFPTPKSSTPEDEEGGGSNVLVNIIKNAVLHARLGSEDNSDGLDPNSSEYKKAVMLSKLGHVVVCAVFSVVAFGLCFILRNPSEVEEKERRLTDNEEEDEGEEEEKSAAL